MGAVEGAERAEHMAAFSGQLAQRWQVGGREVADGLVDGGGVPLGGGDDAREAHM